MEEEKNLLTFPNVVLFPLSSVEIVSVDLECSGAQPKANITTENEKSFSAHD